jgi:hypothetical protein
MGQSYKNHGAWEFYTPSPEDRPAGLPDNVMFYRRVGDGVDWYDYKNNPDNWTKGSVKMTIRETGGTFYTMTVTTDESMLSPPGTTILEVLGYEGTDPKADFYHKIVDMETDTFTPIPLPPAQTVKADIWRRCTEVEAEILEGLLDSLSAKKRRMFSDAQYLGHDDPFFDELYGAVSEALGPERAAVVLAAS